MRDESDNSLDKLEKDLYSRDESPELQARSDELKSPQVTRKNLSLVDAAGKREQPVGLANLAAKRAAKRKKIITYSLIALGLLVIAGLAAGGTLWYRLARTVTEADIGLVVEAPEAITAGDRVTYNVVYSNNSKIDWQNVEVIVELPVGFTFESSSRDVEVSGPSIFLAIGSLPAGESDSVEFTGRLLAAQNSVVAVSSELTMTPENFPSGRFTKTATGTTAINNSPLNIALDIPREASAGERVRASITVSNSSAQKLNNIFLQLTPTPGMQLAVGDAQFSPGFSELDASWQIDTLEPLATVTKEAIIFVQGAAGENRTFEVSTGLSVKEERFVQQVQSSVVAISSSELAISQTYNEATELITIKALEPVKGVINYSNTGSTGLRDVVVSATFEGQGLDAASLKLEGGNYDPTTKKITWTAATVPELALLQPGQSGQILYSFVVQDTDKFPTEGDQNINHALIITSRIDSPDVVVPDGQVSRTIANRFVMSIASNITLNGDGFYDDGRLGITSSGPTPPEIGQETTYTIRLRLGSTLNDLGDVRIVAVLPDGIRYTDKTFKTVGDISFNERAGEFVWSIPLLPALTGRATPFAEADFQVAIIPAENQRGQEIEFLNKLSAVATDLFTDTEAAIEIKDFPTTETAVPGKGRVQ